MNGKSGDLGGKLLLSGGCCLATGLELVSLFKEADPSVSRYFLAHRFAPSKYGRPLTPGGYRVRTCCFVQ